MSKLLKLLKALTAKGFATAEEKAQVQAAFKALEGEDQEVVKEDVEQVEAMPETDPAAADEEKEIEKGVRDIIKKSSDAAVAEAKKAVDDIKSDVQGWLKQQAELREKKVGIYHPQVEEQHKNHSKYLRAFLKGVLDNDVDALTKLNGVSRKELTTDATGSPYGGYAVTFELSAEIRHLITQYGVARSNMTALQLTKNSYKANDLVTDITVYWVDEGAAIKSTAPVLGQKTLDLNKLAVIATLTRELLEDEEVDLFSFIAGRVAELFAKAEDEAAFIGDGTSTYGSQTGALAVSGTNTVTMVSGSTSFLDMTADDLLDMQDKTPVAALKNGKYYMHRSILNVVRKLKGSNGQYIYQEPGGSQPATLWNKPVVLSEVMPSTSDDAISTAFVLFGDLRASSIFGYKGGIAADRFNAGVVRNTADSADINLITTDREAIRWVERVGVLHVLPNALTVLKTAAV